MLEQTTLECAKENPSDLGTKVPENEPKSDQVSRLGIVAAISRFAVLWTTRAKWNCLDDTCRLTRAQSASNEAIVSTVSNDGTVKATGVVKVTGMVGAAGSVSAFVINAGAGGAVAEVMLVWRAAMSRYSAWSLQTRPSAEVQSSTRDQKNEKSVRQVDWRQQWGWS